MKTTNCLFLFLFLLTVPIKVFCLNDDVTDMAIEYFKTKNVKDLCIFGCNNRAWSQKFFRKASDHSIKTLFVDIEFEPLENHVNECLNIKIGILGVILDASCRNYNDVLIMSSSNYLFDFSHSWLVAGDFTNQTEAENETQPFSMLVNSFENLSLSVDADIMLVLQIDDRKYNLFDVYNFGKVQGGKLNVTLFGQWEKSQGLKIWQTGTKYDRRWNFHGITLRLIIVSTKPSVFKPEMLTSLTDAPGINIIIRASYMIFDAVAESHNIKYSYKVADRWISSFYSKNSTRAVTNSLYFREQDLSPNLRIYSEMLSILDFIIIPTAHIETRFYYRIPSSGIGKFENRFLTPLTPQVWMTFLTILGLCALVLILSSRLEHRPLPVQYALFTVIASASQQFFEDPAEYFLKKLSTARKTAVFITGLSCVLIYNYYTSSVVSWLLNGPPPSINSLQELLESPLVLIFEDVGYTKSWLQSPGYCFNYKNCVIEDKLRKQKVLNKQKNDPLFMTLNEGIDLVKVGGYAFHAQVANANQRISEIFDKSELCELGSLSSMPPTKLFAVLQRQSPYKDFFNWSFLRLKERGIISSIQRRTSSPDISCDGSVPRALALGGAAPAFIMLALGFIISLVILSFEIASFKIMKQQQTSLPNFTN